MKNAYFSWEGCDFCGLCWRSVWGTTIIPKSKKNLPGKTSPGGPIGGLFLVIFEVPGGLPRGSLTGNLQGSVALGVLSIIVFVGSQRTSKMTVKKASRRASKSLRNGGVFARKRPKVSQKRSHLGPHLGPYLGAVWEAILKTKTR